MKTNRRPEWLRVRLPAGEGYLEIKRLLRSAQLHTVCEEAQCPNIGECFNQRTATFLILGDVCTRGCRFCNVARGVTQPIDPGEPERVAVSARQMGLRHVVVTSVTRDDIPDGGAQQYADTIAAIRRCSPESTVEVLIPDFRGDIDALNVVIRAKPDIINHNIETVPRLYKIVRPGAVYERSLFLLDQVRQGSFDIVTKSGLMVGLGEESEEIIEVMKDLRGVGCDVLTIGQYLSPGRQHLPVKRFYHPDEFETLRVMGRKMGFTHVESGPLVRSSYHAAMQLDSAQSAQNA